MKVTVDPDRCRGHGICLTLCPEVFTLTDDGYAETLVSEVPGDLVESVRSAVADCPERAIEIVSDPIVD